MTETLVERTADAAPLPYRPDPVVEPGPAHFPCFDGLRAVAALAVVLTHASFLSGANVTSPLGAYFARMDAGVTVFFLISGFLLHRPYAAAHLAGGPARSARTFLRRRLLRIVPAYWVALTVVVFVLRLEEIRSFREAVVYYGFLQVYDRHLVLGGLAQAWSLCTEAAFYLFLPAYVVAVRAAGRQLGPMRAELGGLAVLVAISLGTRGWLWANGLGGHRAFTWLPANADLFALGMLLAVASARAAHTGRVPRPAAFAGRHPGLCWVAASLAFWAVSTQVGLSPKLALHEWWQDLARQSLYGATAFLLLLPAVFGPQDRGLVRRFLASGPMIGLGLVSYGIYLWHKSLLEGLFAWSRRPLFEIGLAPLLVYGLATTLVLAALTWVLVERPALRRK